MSVIEIITLIIALAALVTSCVSAYEMTRQSKNAVRPAIVVLEKFTNNSAREGEGYSLYLVNMGNAMAMNVRVTPSSRESYVAALGAAGRSTERECVLEAHPRTEIAVNRRAVLGSYYAGPAIDKLSMLIQYVDVNGSKYHTKFDGNAHAFGRGHPEPLSLPSFQGLGTGDAS